MALGLLIVADAAVAELSPQTQYEQLCTYDPYCGRLLSDSEWAMPSPSALAVVRACAADVREASDLYDVSAIAIAGVIVAEHTMNVSLVDHVQDLLAAVDLDPTRGSIGLAQIKKHRAFAVERLAAGIERRERRSSREVGRALLVPRQAIYYVAAMMRGAQDTYAAAGFDLASRDDLLATLFNIGYPEERLERTLRERRVPRPNYFGVFVHVHQYAIARAVGLTPYTGLTDPLPSNREEEVTGSGS